VPSLRLSGEGIKALHECVRKEKYGELRASSISFSIFSIFCAVGVTREAIAHKHKLIKNEKKNKKKGTERKRKEKQRKEKGKSEIMCVHYIRFSFSKFAIFC